MSTPAEKLLNSAYTLSVSYGLRLFPCAVKDKRPATAHGFQDATTDPSKLSSWWSTEPYNIGVATGGGLVVLDVDTGNGKPGAETLAALERENGPLPTTWTATTGSGGKHFYYSCADPALTVGVGFAPGLDYRGAGGYVVSPPSVHPSGGVYAWDPGRAPWECGLAALPDWLHGLMLERRKGKAPDPGPAEESAETWTEGRRNAGMFRLACSLRSKGLSESAMLAALLAENETRCVPPLTEKEIKTICGSAAKYRRGKATQGGELGLDVISAESLLDTDFPPVIFVVKNLLAAGLAALVAPPKYGKSWFVLQLCLAVAAGMPFLGYETEPGACVYLSLEDTNRRLKERLSALLDGAAPPAGFDFATSAHDLDHGLMDELEGYAQTHPALRLVVIDTLQKVRQAPKGTEQAYSADYRTMIPLKEFADRRGLCVLVVHHLRKMGDDGDPFNRISGTNGILGALDTALVLTREKRSDQATKLSATGRDIEAQEKIITFDPARKHWSMTGDADDVAEAKARQEYESSAVVRTIKTLLENSPDHTWSGTMSALIEAGKRYHRTYIAPSAQRLGYDLKALDAPLYERDRILHSTTKNGNAGKIHHFCYAFPPAEK